MKQQTLKICQAMDADKSGFFAIDELNDGYDHVEGFAAILSTLDINKEDLACMFLIMDEDRSGSVSYEEFVNKLYRIKNQAAETALVSKANQSYRSVESRPIHL